MSPTTMKRPDPADIGKLAAQIDHTLRNDPEHARLLNGCKLYNSDWTCPRGVMTIDELDLAVDAEPLLNEAVRVLALKAAVYELTGDETLAELPVSRPVDEVLHAVLAQRTLTERMANRAGVQIVHMTDTERDEAPYETGDYTHQAYTAAWGAPPARYWLTADDHTARLRIIEDRLSRIGLHDLGQRHGIRFDQEPQPLAG